MVKSVKKVTAAKVAAVNEATEKNEVVFSVNEKSLYKTAKAIESAIESALKTGNSLMQEYQRIVCSVILHLGQHKDIRIVRNLLDSFPEGFRKVSMSKFIDRYAPVSFDEQGQIHYEAKRKLDLASALVNPWWKAAAEPKYRPFVLEVELQRVLDAAKKRLEKADPEKGDHITAEALNKLSNLVAELHKKEELDKAREEERGALRTA